MNIAILIGEIAYVSRGRILEGLLSRTKREGDNVVLFTCEGFHFNDIPEYILGEYRIFDLPELEEYDGVIVDLDTIGDKTVKERVYNKILEAGIPCVSFNQEIPDAEQICIENTNGFKHLIEHLIVEHGLKDIHYISGPYSNRDAIERLDIFKEVMSRYGLQVPDENIIEGEFDYNSGKNVAKEYIRTNRKLPQAFVAANDYMAIGLVEELRLLGIRVPRDIIVTGYDNCELVKYTEPMLTTVDRGEFEAGVLAYEKLSAMLKSKHKGGKTVVNGKPIYAGSCGCDRCVSTVRCSGQSIVDLKMRMDGGLDLIKNVSLRLSLISRTDDYVHILKNYVKDFGIETFYYCQSGTRKSYYNELEILASGASLDRDIETYQDEVWCPIAYEYGEWSSYPTFSRKMLFPPQSKRNEKGGYYIVMPVHQGKVCIGYAIIGNYDNSLSGRVLQHLVNAIERTLGNQRQNEIMTAMLARINKKWQYDELTGLYNRSGFSQHIGEVIEIAKKENKGVSVLFFDLDGLKVVNDTHGHDAGDAYIKSMADHLKKNTASSDVVCRYGGDEFVIVSAESTEEDSIYKLEAIKASIMPPLSTSAGREFAYINDEGELANLIEQADRKMYEWKRMHGRR